MSLRVEAVGPATVLTIEERATRNAIDRDLCRDIVAAIRAASDDPAMRGVVITGAGPTFLSGANLNMLAELTRQEGGAAEVLGMFDAFSILERCDLPVIAAVQGDTFGGGCEVLLLCDLVIIEEHAGIAFRHARMGLSPAWGGMSRLIERAGPIEATRAILTGEKIGAAEALRIGLVNEVTARGASRDRALATIARIADNGRAAVAALKRTLHEVREARRGASMDRERATFRSLWAGPDHRRAMDDFLAKK